MSVTNSKAINFGRSKSAKKSRSCINTRTVILVFLSVLLGILGLLHFYHHSATKSAGSSVGNSYSGGYRHSGHLDTDNNNYKSIIINNFVRYTPHLRNSEPIANSYSNSNSNSNSVRTTHNSVSSIVTNPSERAPLFTNQKAQPVEQESPIRTEDKSEQELVDDPEKDNSSHETKLDVTNSISASVDGNIIHGMEEVNKLLLSHPFRQLSDEQRKLFQMEDYFNYLHNQPQCIGKPIITTMANVFSDLYWQLIENFVYSMVKFGHSACTIMVCVTDAKCLRLCEESNFPCINFRYDQFHPELTVMPSALEQIGELKLFHIPKALKKGVDILMIDLDVGFIEDPMKMLGPLMQDRKVDVFVQKDISYVMNRTLEGWRTWYTVPMPNIGLFLCRGNPKTVRMFDIAWKGYNSITAKIKHNPGKDQNKVINALRRGSSFGLIWHYIPTQSAVLLDKIYKFQDRSYELGGEAALRVLNDKGATAVHTTCYEQKAKVNGLKAANAFYNPKYYNPERKTITKQLVFQTEAKLRQEIRSLLYLAVSTNRSLILPNVLGNEKLGEVDLYQGRAMWPGFRLAFFRKTFSTKVDILEPAFYWQLRRNLPANDKALDSRSIYTVVPKPTVVSFPYWSADSDSTDTNQRKRLTLKEVEEVLHSPDYRETPRIVLDFLLPNDSVNKKRVVSDAQSKRVNASVKLPEISPDDASIEVSAPIVSTSSLVTKKNGNHLESIDEFYSYANVAKEDSIDADNKDSQHSPEGNYTYTNVQADPDDSEYSYGETIAEVSRKPTFSTNNSKVRETILIDSKKPDNAGDAGDVESYGYGVDEAEQDEHEDEEKISYAVVDDPSYSADDGGMSYAEDDEEQGATEETTISYADVDDGKFTRRSLFALYNEYYRPIVETEERLTLWAEDSVGNYGEYRLESKRYQQMPLLKYQILETNEILATDELLMYNDVALNITKHTRLCANIFDPSLGNRSCFDKCD